VLVFLLFSKNVVKGSARELFGFSRSFVSKFIVTAAPVLLNESMWALGTNIYVMVLSRQGTENYSAYSIYETVQQLFFVFFVGICHASAIMVGKACGRGDREEAYETAKRFLIMTPLSGVVLGVILILVRNPLLSLFEFETEGARAITSALLLFYGVWIGIRMIPYTAVCGIFRAGGDTRIGCIYEIGTLYLIGIPMVCIAAFVLHLPFVAIVATMCIAEDIPKGTLCIIYFLRKKWIRKLT
jgi:Na+-driven multidrug efflux pump